ncbi:uncharacterized protein K452DRAFT_266155 [Aplosporella prunicola CBS 121167]|uniref:Cytochrome c oxidase assembly protein COX20, mitochondrial n=1 Tax=Aplosporella prunicola CBS 121167 TaxID=1176127 RepID=A0A6A6BL44_9PEZI|nr:uncharacterized protein K452DRAFT_266155 [Aplosporella prunicola CBS 121167]KAF2144388.1 hypothetical protein K452DRAFT_266155 [Aplosporella prunicola CBS 121167]
MADDTRQGQAPAPDVTQSGDPNVRPYQGKVYEAVAAPQQRQNPNIMPGGTQHTAGGEKVEELALSKAVGMIQPHEFFEIHKYPCVREALLTGIGTGFGIGGIMGIWGKPLMKSCNWAMGAFCIMSIGGYEFCKRKIQLEKEGLTRAVEVMERKKDEKKIRREQAIAARRKAKEEQDRLDELRMKEEAKRSKSWWKVW